MAQGRPAQPAGSDAQRRFSWDGYSSDSSAATTVRTTTTPDSIYDGHSDAASSWEDPSRAASHAEPSERLPPQERLQRQAMMHGESIAATCRPRGW